MYYSVNNMRGLGVPPPGTGEAANPTGWWANMQTGYYRIGRMAQRPGNVPPWRFFNRKDDMLAELKRYGKIDTGTTTTTDTTVEPKKKPYEPDVVIPDKPTVYVKPDVPPTPPPVPDYQAMGAYLVPMTQRGATTKPPKRDSSANYQWVKRNYTAKNSAGTMIAPFGFVWEWRYVAPAEYVDPGQPRIELPPGNVLPGLPKVVNTDGQPRVLLPVAKSDGGYDYQPADNYADVVDTIPTDSTVQAGIMGGMSPMTMLLIGAGAFLVANAFKDNSPAPKRRRRRSR